MKKILCHIYFFVAFCDNGDRQRKPCKQQILDPSKLKEFADENGRKFSKRVKNTMLKGEIALYEQFLLLT